MADILKNTGNIRKREKDVWEIQQLEQLFKLYEQHGPNWRQITNNFENKQLHAAKNKIKIALIKTTNILEMYQKEYSRKACSKIKLDTINTILDCGFQFQEHIRKLGRQLSGDSFLLKLRHQIIEISYKPEQYGQEQIIRLIRKIKYFNTQIRTYSIYKIKNRKCTKIGDNLLKKIEQLDEKLHNIDLYIHTRKQKNRQTQSHQVQELTKQSPSEPSSLQTQSLVQYSAIDMNQFNSGQDPSIFEWLDSPLMAHPADIALWEYQS